MWESPGKNMQNGLFAVLTLRDLFFLVSSHPKQSMQILFCFAYLIQGLNASFFLSTTPAWKLHRFEEGNLRKEREASRGEKKTTDSTEQKLQSNRAKFASQDKALFDRFPMPGSLPVPPEPQGKATEWKWSHSFFFFFKATHTHTEHRPKTVWWVVLCWALALSPDCSVQSIWGSVASTSSGQGYNVQTEEGKSMVPTTKSNIDFTITGTNCSNR